VNRDDIVAVDRTRVPVNIIMLPGGEHVGAVLPDRKMPLAISALWGADDDAGLVAVQLLLVVPVQGDTPTAGDGERDDRAQDRRDLKDVGDLVDAQVHRGREDVVAAACPRQAVKGHQRGHHGGAGGDIPGSLEQVVLPLVTGDPRLEEGHQDQDGQHERGRQHDR
jgi:hypothetical protein